MMRIELKSGEFVYIDGQEDLLNLIEDHLGESVKNEIEESIQESYYYAKSKDDEIISYESTLDDYNSFLFDLKDEIENISKEINKERINKTKLYAMLNIVEKKIYNFL